VSARCLVVQNDPTSDLALFREWLSDGGLELETVRPYAGDPLPADVDGYVGLVVLGGGQHVYPNPDGSRDVDWFDAVESLLRKAVRGRTATLGICLGAQLLASAHAGTVAPATAGPEIGTRLVAKRDAAESDPLFGPMPMLPDVIQWHHDEVAELPMGAVLLATSTNYAVQAFRIGTAAWGVQFHPECDIATLAGWVADEASVLANLGLSGREILASAEALQDDMFEVWHPFAIRFAAFARGELAPPPDAPVPGHRLPLLGE